MCRAFLSKYIDENGEELHAGRFNLGAISLNLPRIAIETGGDTKAFFELLDKRLQVAHDALMTRINRLLGVKAEVAPILYMEGATGARLDAKDTIDHLMQGGRSTISLGYIGINEVMVILKGRGWQKDPASVALSVDIVKYMKEAVLRWREEEDYGFALYSTPSESLCMRFHDLDKEKFGIIPGVTDKGFYTNSFHYDVQEPISLYDKIDFEAPYMQYASAGFISYGEYDSVRDNIDALESVVTYAMGKIPYYGANVPADMCFECGYEGEFVATEDGYKCPNCGNHNPKTCSCVKRTCGYLGEPSSRPFNTGKQEEVMKRTKHK